MYLTILQSFTLIGLDRNIFIKNYLRFKYGQDHWKWYEQVTLSDLYQQAKCDIYHIYGVWENPNVKVFNEPRHLTNQNHINYLP